MAAGSGAGDVIQNVWEKFVKLKDATTSVNMTPGLDLLFAINIKGGWEIYQIKMEKVDEPNVSDVWQCPRCHQDFCGECVDACEVDFDIKENINFERPDLDPHMENWKGEYVCPWCYNQLVVK